MENIEFSRYSVQESDSNDKQVAQYIFLPIIPLSR